MPHNTSDKPRDLREVGPQKSRCVKCKKHNHMRCRWLTHGVDCGCACSWLVADMIANFPSLREIALTSLDATTVDDESP